MSEKTDQQESDHVFAIFQRAYHIALDRKICRLREKCRGDNLSVKLSKWHEMKAKNEVAALLLPALQRAENLLSCKTGDAFNKFVEAILIGSLPKPRGRPGAARGIIGRAMAEANKKPVVSLVARLKSKRKFSQRVDDVRIDLLAEKHAETKEGMLRKLSKYPDNMDDVTVAEAISSLLQKDPELAAEHSRKRRTALYNYYKRGKISVKRCGIPNRETRQLCHRGPIVARVHGPLIGALAHLLRRTTGIWQSWLRRRMELHQPVTPTMLDNTEGPSSRDFIS